MRRRRARTTACSAAAAIGLVVALSMPAAGAAAAAKPTGSPIAVQFVNLGATSSTAPAREGAKAAVKHLNRTGGIAARPVQLDECTTDQTPETGKACIDAAIAAAPAAVLSVQPGTAADNLAALTAAGIPYVGQTCNTNSTLSGQFSSFCFGSDFVGLYASAAGYLKTLGTVKRAVLPFVNVPAASSGVKAYADPILVQAGITPVEVPIPEGTDDITAAITPALESNPDALIGLLTGPGCISTMQLKSSLASPKPFVLPALCTDPDVISDGGAGAKGTLFVRQTITLDKKNPDVKAYRAAMKRYAKGADADDVYAQAGFAAVMNLAAAMRQVPAGTTIDAASTTAALRAARAVPMFLSSGATYACDGTAYAGLKALCSVQSHVVEYQGKGRWIDKGVF